MAHFKGAFIKPFSVGFSLPLPTPNLQVKMELGSPEKTKVVPGREILRPTPPLPRLTEVEVLGTVDEEL